MSGFPFITQYRTRIVHSIQHLMPLTKASTPHKRKRQLSEAEPETEISLQRPAKQQKLKEQQPDLEPSNFWDNLSRVWLTPGALREFDRRTVWPVVPVTPYRTGKESIDLTKLKRFARHGGANLGDIRGVSSIRSIQVAFLTESSIRIPKNWSLQAQQ